MTMQWCSRMAPQHPKKAITKIIQPITITPIADVELLPCISDEKPFRFICTRTPQIKRAKPHSYRIINIPCGSLNFTGVTSTELGAVPEEDEEVATSSTPSTVVSPSRAPLFIEGRDRSLSFHERATSKDVINELNRMIRKGEDHQTNQKTQVSLDKLDLACCCPTGWVHVERDIDFTDPKARANLLDVMLASSESSSATSSSGSAGSDSGDEPTDYRHLHRLHRYRRQKKDGKAYAVCFDCHEKSYVVRLSDDQFL
ncbi:hypothetical protein PV327_010217 [Microctonus hyperodae]|uniref:Uncharacterized protein n=1 Tax=Microctonus hyperodae TaxID=165561 RepID=A0AA39FRF7_MICHY|nr:hypothetical protein PV327_010217 [Microctonus hyperodae]